MSNSLSPEIKLLIHHQFSWFPFLNGGFLEGGLVHMDNEVPTEITLEDKTASEQLRLIAELDEKDKSVIFGLIETMLTKKKSLNFFQKNIAAL